MYQSSTGTLLGLQSWTLEKRKSISLRWIMNGTSTIQYHCFLVLCVLVFVHCFNRSHCFTDRLIHYNLQVQVQQLRRCFEKWIPHIMKHLYKGEKLLLEQFLSRNFFFMMIMLLNYVWVISESKFFPRHACSGPAILHSLKATGFSVSPTTPLQLFTIILFCSWPDL